MITTADYLIKASVGKVEYFFEHNENDVWDVLESFWHDDYPEVLDGKDGSALFPMDVYAMHDGLVITSYRFTFNAAVFRAFFDKGHTAEGRYTLDQFALDIERKPDAFQLAVVFGEQATRLYNDCDFDGLNKTLKEGTGSAMVADFATDAERQAYVRGLRDMNGWMDFAVVHDDEMDKIDFDN